MDVYVWVHYMCSSTFRDVPYTFILVSNSEVQALALLHIHTHTHLYIYTQIYILHITNWISTFCVHTSALVCVYASAPCATASLTSAYACFPKPFVVLHAATLISLHCRSLSPVAILYLHTLPLLVFILFQSPLHHFLRELHLLGLSATVCLFLHNCSWWAVAVEERHHFRLH